MKRGKIILALSGLISALVAGSCAYSQETLSEARIVSAALANPINTQASALGVQQQQRLLNGVAGYDNLQVTIATDPYDPMELGIDQVFDFPTAYARRRGLQRANVGLAEKAVRVNEYEVKRRAREAYLQLQFLHERVEQLRFQDSLFQSISVAAGRSFQAGQVTKLEQQFADNRYQNVHNQYVRALTEYEALQEQLRVFTGLTTAFIPEGWPAASAADLDSSVAENPSLALLKQEVEVSKKQVGVARADALPGFVTGVGIGLEQEHRNRLVGVRAGLTLPLFFGQNRARIQAAELGVRVAEAQARAGVQNITQQYVMARATLQRERQSLRYFETVALPTADDIMNTARRLFSAGQLSYIEYLRNVAEAFDNKLNYLQTQRDYRQALIDVQYLNGSL